jgi:hypothetical protein
VASVACFPCQGAGRVRMLGGAGTLSCESCQGSGRAPADDLDPLERRLFELQDQLRREREKSARLQALALALEGTPEERARVVDAALMGLE